MTLFHCRQFGGFVWKRSYDQPLDRYDPCRCGYDYGLQLRREPPDCYPLVAAGEGARRRHSFC